MKRMSISRIRGRRIIIFVKNVACCRARFPATPLMKKQETSNQISHRLKSNRRLQISRRREAPSLSWSLSFHFYLFRPAVSRFHSRIVITRSGDPESAGRSRWTRMAPCRRRRLLRWAQRRRHPTRACSAEAGTSSGLWRRSCCSPAGRCLPAPSPSGGPPENWTPCMTTSISTFRTTLTSLWVLS